MNCSKCGKEYMIPDALFCPYCGSRFQPEEHEKKRHARMRGNGQGTAYKRGRTWTARVVAGWKTSDDETHLIPVYRTRGGFKSKKEAQNYCATLLEGSSGQRKISRITLEELFKRWKTSYSGRVGASTMAGYKAAFKHYEKLNNRFVDEIIPDDLQKCMDSCPAGKRTHQMMKVIAGLLWAYAKENRHTDEDITENLYTGKGESVQREPITEEELEVIRQAIGVERYADYIYCLCYLGFRPGEFLALKKSDFKVIDGVEFLQGGSKTKAGKDRLVIIPEQIADMVRARLFVPGTDLLFPQYNFKRGSQSFDLSPDKKTGKPKPPFTQMLHDHFNKGIFQPMMKRLNIAEGKVPYSARHTYSDKLKRASGSDKTKAGLMGHTDYTFTQQKYQSTDVKDYVEVAASIK